VLHHEPVGGGDGDVHVADRPAAPLAHRQAHDAERTLAGVYAEIGAGLQPARLAAHPERAAARIGQVRSHDASTDAPSRPLVFHHDTACFRVLGRVPGGLGQQCPAGRAEREVGRPRQVRPNPGLRRPQLSGPLAVRRELLTRRAQLSTCLGQPVKPSAGLGDCYRRRVAPAITPTFGRTCVSSCYEPTTAGQSNTPRAWSGTRQGAWFGGRCLAKHARDNEVAKCCEQDRQQLDKLVLSNDREVGHNLIRNFATRQGESSCG
jgi:hypothetical protein